MFSVQPQSCSSCNVNCVRSLNHQPVCVQLQCIRKQRLKFHLLPAKWSGPITRSHIDRHYRIHSNVSLSVGTGAVPVEHDKANVNTPCAFLQLSINAFDYNCHVDLIKLLRQEGKLHRLRKARQKMSELFPLTEGPEIWLEYVQYSIGGMGAQGGIERVRSIFERALTAVGLHMTKGASIWEAYREFEILLNAQLERIHTLFRRQLAVPLMDMEGTYAEYSDWADDGVPEMVTRQYRRALQQLEKGKPFEEALLVSEPPKLAEYQAYIDFEMKEGDPARVQIIFERALAENCLVPDLWIKYTTYLDRQLKIRDLVLSAHERAVRNCPWTMGLWKSYLLALERHGADHQTVTDVFEKALNAGFIQATDYVEIWQSFLDYLRRRVDFKWSRELDELRAAFARSLDYLKQDVEERFSESGDLSCTIMQIWARIEALHCKNMQKARELWDSIMTKGNAKHANMWLEYYNLERSYGDASHCRKALHRAVQCTSDYPEHVCDVLLNFERVEGSLEDWDAAVQKTETKINRVNEQRVAEKEALQARQEEEKVEHRRKAKADKKGQKKSQKVNRTGDKRKADDEYEEEWGEDAELPSKRLRGEDDFGSTATEELMETESGLFGRRAPPRKTEPPGFRKNQRGSSEAPQQPQDVSKEQRIDENCVFVSNLAFNLDDPEGKLRALFQGCGTVQQVRPVFSMNGVFRGYCYVQFEDRLAVPEALKLDRKEVDGRPMYVSPCVDKNKNPDFKVFKYKTAMEKHKIFISGLPYTCTKETLEDLCKQHGTVKAIRLVTNRSGKPKGLAYVEYENEAQASQAVLKMDGSMLENFTLSVAISNPPSRKMEDKGVPSRLLGAAMPRQPQGARGKGRTQISLLPRSLYRQSTPDAKAENGTISAPHTTETDGSLSNEDFARMLLKK
uniref:Squamous cell carcinoma antigen recognized by T-cells 3 n=1 Tax=Cyprinus carpio TaxID=7962 RepID=A0A8C2E7L4_CYPCA